MSRIRWYGPTFLLLITVVIAMALGPSIARRIAQTYRVQHIQQVRQDLADNQTLGQMSDSFTKVATVVRPSLTSISVFHRDRRGVESNQSNGSGWVYRHFPDIDDEAYSNDYIITNHHVVEDFLAGRANHILVHFDDNSDYYAAIVGTDTKTDVAVLKIERTDMIPASISLTPVKQGEIVFAFGSPYHFDFSMSQGVVSATGRQLIRQLPDGTAPYEDYIQTDAAINPGNSGGPLTNVRGDVIGMNTAIATRDNPAASFSGLGFAIPTHLVVGTIDQLIRYGEVRRGYLGVVINEIDGATADELGFTGHGVLCTPVVGGPAFAANIELGDIITHIQGVEITSVEKLRIEVSSHQPGIDIQATIWRLGSSSTRTIHLAQHPDTIAGMRSTPTLGADPVEPLHNTQLARLGLERLQSFTPAMAENNGWAYTPGVYLRLVRSSSPATRAGVLRTMIVTHIDGRPINEVEDLLRLTQSLDHGDPTVLSVKDWSPGSERYTQRDIELVIP